MNIIMTFPLINKPHPQIKTLAAVLLRRMILKVTDELMQIDSGILGACRAELLEALQTEKEGMVRRKICDAVAELARAAIGVLDR